jgi:PAS domain S-box-containing protein
MLAGQAVIAIENAELYRTLQEEQAQLQAILEAMAEGLVYIDLTTQRLRYANQAFMDLTGRTLENILELPVRADGVLLHVSEGYLKLVDLVKGVTNQKVWRGAVQARRWDGIPLDLLFAISTILDPNGTPMGAVVLVRDIGTEKALQTQKDRFIAHAAHELRTPVTNLKLRLYLAHQQPNKLQEHLSVIEDTTNYLKNLVESLLEVSRFERGMIVLKREPIFLQDVLTLAMKECQMQAEQKHIHLINDMQSEPLPVSIDPIRIRQVADNLIINAINYTPEGGQVKVRAFAEHESEASYAIFRVQDTGIGITSENITRVFEPFYRVVNGGVKGTGLGLTITKEIVDRHDGRITVESRVGEGSTFSVWLPQ